jgi:hypothetical protein
MMSLLSNRWTGPLSSSQPLRLCTLHEHSRVWPSISITRTALFVRGCVEDRFCTLLILLSSVSGTPGKARHLLISAFPNVVTLIAQQRMKKDQFG